MKIVRAFVWHEIQNGTDLILSFSSVLRQTLKIDLLKNCFHFLNGITQHIYKSTGGSMRIVLSYVTLIVLFMIMILFRRFVLCVFSHFIGLYPTKATDWKIPIHICSFHKLLFTIRTENRGDLCENAIRKLQENEKKTRKIKMKNTNP